MDEVLSHYLPVELGDLIARQVHQLNFHRTLMAIKYNLIWVRCAGEYSFLIHHRENYYQVLLDLAGGSTPHPRVIRGDRKGA